MKVLHLGQTIGGLDTYIRNVCRTMPRSVNFIIVHGNEDNSKSFYNCEGDLIVEHLVPLYRRINLFHDIATFFKVLKIVYRFKPTIIHAHSAKGGFFGRIIGFLTRIKTFYTPHAFSFLASPNPMISSLFLFVERATRFNANLLACSESERDIGVSRVGYRTERALVWSNSVPDIYGKVEDYKAKERFVCSVGRPSYQKNTRFLINAVASVVKLIPDFKLYILGVGYHSPELENVKKLIENFGIGNNVLLLPWVDQEEVLSIINASEFYVSSSRYEGLPLSVLEAMSLGKAIVATSVFGNVDCVIDQENGFLVSQEEELFSKAIINLWVDENLKRQFGKQSRKIYEERFDLSNTINNLLFIYSH